MRYDDASQMSSAGQEPVARNDVDELAAGSFGPETGNIITGEGTVSGALGADLVGDGPGSIVAVSGAGGEASGDAGGTMQVEGQYGTLTIDAQGNYSYVRHADTPDGVEDVFTYTLADSDGDRATATLTIQILRDPNLLGELVPTDGVVVLPAGVELSDIRVVGRDLVITMPDGSLMIIPGGAVFVPQLVIGDVELPASNLAALLIDAEPQPAAGPPESSGGNFGVEVGPLDPGVPLGDLIPPTELDYTPPVFEDVGQFIDNEPTIAIQPDGQPASVNAVDSVDEAGLPARGDEPEGSNSEADSETTTGTIIFDSPDGPNVVTINGVVVTSVGQTIAGAHGTLTITSIGEGTIGYSYTLLDNTFGDDTADEFTVSVTDNDGDVATATLTINIIDDVPTAEPDTDSIAAGEFGPVTGNVITDAAPGDEGDDDDGADTVGADDAHVTSISGAGGSDSSFNEDGELVVAGEYGVLTMDADGNYSYTRNEGTPGGVTDTFEYVLTDGDGDTATSTLTIDIGDLTPQTGENPTVLLDDDALPGGNPGGIGDDPDSVNTTGTLSASGGDGALTFSLLTTGAPEGFTYVAGPDGSVLVQQDGVTVLTITVDADTGEYSVTQNAAIDHPAGDDENNVEFTITYQVEDVDGDTATGSLTINVDDDTPVISLADVATPTLTVDETDLDIDASGDFSSLFDVDFGADGPGTTSFALVVVDGTDSGLVDVATGESIFLFDNEGVIEGRVGGVDGEVAFTVSVTDSGVVTLDQQRALDHPDATDHDDPVSPNDSSIQLAVTATDADGDPVSESVNIGGSLVFEDDGPSVSGAVAGAGVTLDETDAGSPAGFPISATSTTAAITATTAFGADGAGTITYGLSLPAGGDSGLQTAIGDHPITLVLVNATTIEGQYEDGGTQVAFTIEMNADGTITVTQNVPLEHLIDGSSAAAHDDSLDLSGLVNATVTVTDGDGDTATDSAEIGNNIVFDDDGPSIDVTAASDGDVVLTTDDADTVGGSDSDSSTANFGGVFGLTFDGGGDGAAGTPTLSYTLGVSAQGVDSGLTQGGDTIFLYEIGGEVVGSTSSTEAGVNAANTVFDVSVDADGVVTLTQHSQIDHPIASDPDATDAPFDDHIVSLSDDLITLTATATVTDNDGDTDTDSATIGIGANLQFTDDGPNAQVDGEAVLDTLVLDETRPLGTETDGDSDPAGLATITADFSDNFATVDFGADGPGSTSYSLTLDGSDVASGLYALDPSDTTDTDGDGIGQGEEIVLNQSGNTITGSAGGVDYFTITIDPVTGVVTFTQLANIWHADTSNDDDTSMLDAAAGSLLVVQTVTDFDGDTDSASIDISSGVFQIEDDGPTADDEAEQDVAEGDSIVGQFDFTTGTDGGSVTHVNGIELVFGGDGYSQDIAVDDGTIKVKADGTYTFTADDSASGVTSGTFTVTDGDGDTETADWSFNITDANFPTAGESEAVVDDEGLPGGITGGPGDIVVPDNDGDNDESTFSGTLDLDFGGDGPGSVSFADMDGETGTVGTEDVEYSWNGATNTLTATITSGARTGTDLYQVTVDDPTTGDYSVTLLTNVLHVDDGTDTENDATDVLNFTVVDSDGSEATGTLTITFDDDVPTVDVTVGDDDGVILQTDDADTEGAASDSDSSTANFAGVFSVTFAAGADGAATSTLSYTLGVSVQGVDSGLTQGGDTIYLYEIDGEVVGSTSDTEAGVNAANTVFDVSVDTDGVVTLTQYSQIDHPIADDPDATDAPFDDHIVSLDDGLITLTATATITDNDGDTATDSETVNIGANLQFTDDGPVAVDDIANQVTENDDVTVDVFANDDGGADGVNLVTGVAVVPGTLTGSGTLTYNGDGTFTYEPAANEEGTITFDYEITDFDGDTSTATVTINLQDDSNPAPVNATASVDDEGLANGITGGDGDLVVPDTDGDNDESTFGGTLTADFGGDAPGTFSLEGMDGETATIGTEDVIYDWDGTTDTLTATITSGDRTGTELFQVTLDPTTGDYSVTLLTNVLHTYDGTNTENDATAVLTFTATDSEGEGADGTLTITFDDDMPEAFDPDPITSGLENLPGSTETANLDVDGDINNNIGADLPGLVSFANITNGDDSGLTSGEDPIEYWLSNDGQTLEGRTNSTDGTDGELIFTIDLNQADGTYTVTMSGIIDNGAGTSFDDLTSTSAGNANYRGVGTDDPTTTIDLLLSASAGGADATVNTNATAIGAANQSMDDGEAVRIDFVSNLTSGAATPTGFGYDDHVSSNSFIGEIPQVQGNQAQTVSFTVYALDSTLTEGTAPDRDPSDGFSDSTITQITEVTVTDYLTGESTTQDITGFTVGVFTAVAYGITVRPNADGSVTFAGVQEGDSYGFRTDNGDFNAVVIAAHGSFDLGVFAIGTVDSGEPINILFDLQLTDADGDTVVVEDALDITIAPEDLQAAAVIGQESLIDSSSKTMLSSDSSEQMLKMNAANNNTVLLGAIAAAGLAAVPAAASVGAESSNMAFGAEYMAQGEALMPVAAAGGEQNRSALAGETKEAANDPVMAPRSSGGDDAQAGSANGVSGSEASSQAQVSALSQGTDAPAQTGAEFSMADSIPMPSAEALVAAAKSVGEEAQGTAEVGRVLADALSGGDGPSIDALLDSLPAKDGAVVSEAIASLAETGVPAWDMATFADFTNSQSAFKMEDMILHPDAGGSAA